MKNSAFTNEQILSWMQYFSAQTAIDLERIKIVDMSREDKNLLPAIHNFRTVLAFLDAGQNGIFYKLWDAGLGDCDVWLGEGLTPDGKPIRPCKLPGVLRQGSPRPAQAAKPGALRRGPLRPAWAAKPDAPSPKPAWARTVPRAVPPRVFPPAWQAPACSPPPGQA